MPPALKIAVILPAAGAGKRFAAAGGTSGAAASGGGGKIEMELNGRAVLLRSVELFLKRPEVCQILVAVNPDRLDQFKFRWGDQLAFHGVSVVAGGRQERWETVQKALAAVKAEATHVAVHDAVRPLASRQLIDRLFEEAARRPAVIPAIPVANTLKRVQEVAPKPQDRQRDPLDAILGDAGRPTVKLLRVVETIERSNVVEVQTPQVFEAALLRRAYAQLGSGKIDPAAVTDDAALVEALGEPVWVVEGEPTNIKITRPGDATLAEALLRMTEQAAAATLGKKRLFADEDE